MLCLHCAHVLSVTCIVWREISSFAFMWDLYIFFIHPKQIKNRVGVLCDLSIIMPLHCLKKADPFCVLNFIIHSNHWLNKVGQSTGLACILFYQSFTTTQEKRLSDLPLCFSFFNHTKFCVSRVRLSAGLTCTAFYVLSITHSDSREKFNRFVFKFLHSL